MTHALWKKKKESAPKLLPDGFCSPATHWVEFLSKVAFIFSYTGVFTKFCFNSCTFIGQILNKYLIKLGYSEKATKFEKKSPNHI